jgi:hypothetical protein
VDPPGTSRAAIANPRLADLDRADAGLDGPLRQMTVPHEPLPAVIRGKVSVGREEIGDFGLDGLGEKRARTVAQHFGQRIGEFSRLAQGDNCIIFHGVSFLWDLWQLITATIRRLPYPAPSPTFLLSSTPTTAEWTDIIAKQGHNSCFQIIKTPASRRRAVAQFCGS